MQEKYGFVYIWYDSAKSKQNGPDKIRRFYIGRHWGTEDDGYICSSNWMRDAYRRRPEDFERKIISKTNIKEELLNSELKWLSFIKEEELGKKYYNLNKNPYSGAIEHSEDIIKKIKKNLPNNRSGKNHYMYGKKHTEETKLKMRKPKSNVKKITASIIKRYENGEI